MAPADTVSVSAVPADAVSADAVSVRVVLADAVPADTVLVCVVPAAVVPVRKVVTSAGSATAGMINGRAKAATPLLSKNGSALGPERHVGRRCRYSAHAAGVRVTSVVVQSENELGGFCVQAKNSLASARMTARLLRSLSGGWRRHGGLCHYVVPRSPTLRDGRVAAVASRSEEQGVASFACHGGIGDLPWLPVFGSTARHLACA
jgi:hypothetical protein